MTIEQLQTTVAFIYHSIIITFLNDLNDFQHSISLTFFEAGLNVEPSVSTGLVITKYPEAKIDLPLGILKNV